MRTAFINELILQARIHNDIFLLVGDLGYSVVEPFAQEFPDRFLNVGIAEQNMAGIAAGLAMEGYNVYIYSIGNFPTLRSMEQIRYDICYHNLNVRIVAVGGGFAYGPLGASHHTTEEIGMLRTIPNLVVTAPGDPVEARAIVEFTTQHKGPVYIRIGKAGEPIVHTTEKLSLHLGEILNIRKGHTNAILSTGAMLYDAVNFVQKNNINASVYSFPFIKPVSREAIQQILSSYQRIITIEEHQAQGGFGSAILELANDLLESRSITSIPSIIRKAIPDKFISLAGSQSYLRKLSGLELHLIDFMQD